MSNITLALVAGLPAYVLVKILSPGFFARSDTRTPVYTALAALAVNVSLNFWFIWGLGWGIVGLAGATAFSASLNCLLLYTVLHRRGWFHFTAHMANRIARQLISVAAMSAVLWWLMDVLFAHFSDSVIERVWSLVVLVGAGLVAYGAVGWLVGAVDRDEINQVLRRRKATPESAATIEASP
jgi:putative peptidoglycan lipid II flippase